MESFQELDLPEFLRQSIKQMNFIKPMPVQAQAIPAALQGKDIVASAQTGTGKTAAFGIPMLAFLAAHPDQTSLVLTPTRELAVQVLDVLRKLSGTKSSWGSVLLIGGAHMGSQLSALTRKPRLVIGTPGRVIDHLNRGSLTLAHTGFLVLDEADRMLDMGFAPQLEAIRRKMPVKKQTLLFSATIPSNIQAMAASYLKDPVRITVGSVSQPVLKIAQMIIHTSEPKKPDELLGELNERQGSILVFARTQNRVDRIAERLKEKGLKVTRIHGGRTQSQRRQAIEQFRDGNYRILVATDIAARGLDIHHIAHVINYDLPRNPEDYIHRVGRTARAGAEGSSLCFLTVEDRSLWESILRLTKAPKDSIQVKASRFGDFTPKPHSAPRTSGHPMKKNQPYRPSNGGRFDRPSQDRGPKNHSRPPQGDHRRGSEQVSQGFRPERKDFRTEGTHRKNGFDGANSAPHRRPRSSEGRHQQRSESHHRNTQFNRRDSQGNNFIFHGPEEDRQPDQNVPRDSNPKPEGFIKRFGQKFMGAKREHAPSRPFSREGHPGARRESRTPGEHRPHRFENKRHESTSAFPREHHPRSEHRPHRPAQSRDEGFGKSSTPRGNFKGGNSRPHSAGGGHRQEGR
ncbi:MAG TPA: DEAD/DEAH box helicase [bacterium]